MKLSDFIPHKNRAVNGSDQDLGFGTKITGSAGRLFNKDGSYNIVRRGLSVWTPYQTLVEMTWPTFFALVFLLFILVNCFFALLLVSCGPAALMGAPEGRFFSNFLHAFFFSVQTFTTVGYGSISPQGIPANIVASIDALVGLMAFALATGLFFARFSKPKAQIIFSEKGIIAPYQDVNAFMFRIVNPRNNKIINLEAIVTMTWIEERGGETVRRFAKLELEREKVSLFPLNWTIVHPIDDNSPLYRLVCDDLTRMQTEILILIQGYDETFAQNVHLNSSYTCQEILWDVKYAKMYHAIEGQTLLYLDKLNDTIALDEEE
mgnify:CR=1 FL=1